MSINVTDISGASFGYGAGKESIHKYNLTATLVRKLFNPDGSVKEEAANDLPSSVKDGMIDRIAAIAETYAGGTGDDIERWWKDRVSKYGEEKAIPIGYSETWDRRDSAKLHGDIEENWKSGWAGSAAATIYLKPELALMEPKESFAEIIKPLLKMYGIDVDPKDASEIYFGQGKDGLKRFLLKNAGSDSDISPASFSTVVNLIARQFSELQKVSSMILEEAAGKEIAGRIAVEKLGPGSAAAVLYGLPVLNRASIDTIDESRRIVMRGLISKAAREIIDGRSYGITPEEALLLKDLVSGIGPAEMEAKILVSDMKHILGDMGSSEFLKKYVVDPINEAIERGRIDGEELPKWLKTDSGDRKNATIAVVDVDRDITFDFDEFPNLKSIHIRNFAGIDGAQLTPTLKLVGDGTGKNVRITPSPVLRDANMVELLRDNPDRTTLAWLKIDMSDMSGQDSANIVVRPNYARPEVRKDGVFSYVRRKVNIEGRDTPVMETATISPVEEFGSLVTLVGSIPGEGVNYSGDMSGFKYEIDFDKMDPSERSKMQFLADMFFDGGSDEDRMREIDSLIDFVSKVNPKYSNAAKSSLMEMAADVTEKTFSGEKWDPMTVIGEVVGEYLDASKFRIGETVDDNVKSLPKSISSVTHPQLTPSAMLVIGSYFDSKGIDFSGFDRMFHVDADGRLAAGSLGTARSGMSVSSANSLVPDRYNDFTAISITTLLEPSLFGVGKAKNEEVTMGTTVQEISFDRNDIKRLAEVVHPSVLAGYAGMMVSKAKMRDRIMPASDGRKGRVLDATKKDAEAIVAPLTGLVVAPNDAVLSFIEERVALIGKAGVPIGIEIEDFELLKAVSGGKSPEITREVAAEDPENG